MNPNLQATPVTATSAPPSRPSQDALGARRLQPQAPVGLVEGICLAYRLASSDCRRCIDACPTRALAFDDGRIELVGDCTHCGRCQAACPTGAARVEGFAGLDRAIGSPTQPIEVRCWKSPQPVDTGRQLIRVPCVNGLSDGQFAALRAASLPQPMRFVDHGWCAGCRSSHGESISRRVEAGRALLRETGLPDELQPSIRSEVLSIAQMPAEMPEATGQRRLGRRAFFSSLVRETFVPSAISLAVRETAADAAVRRTDAGLHARAELIGSLAAIARAGGKAGVAALPPRMFAKATIGETCCDHGVCVAHCPTGALSRQIDSDETTIAFDTAACIACGHCQTVCPGSAIRIKPARGYQAVTTLRRFAARQCDECGAALSHREEELSSGLCGHCFKSRRLARSAFTQLFGARG